MRTACFIAVTAIALLGPAHAQRPQRPIKLFNGKDLSGWVGDPARWSVTDGIITGSADAADGDAPEQEFSLIYKAGQVDDFELKLQVRISDGTRAGVFYRGQVLDSPEPDLAGYRLVIQPQRNRIGMLDEPGRRGPLVQRGTSARLDPGGQRRVLGPVDTSTAIDTTQWNEYSITARGNRLIHKINGVVTCSAVDNDTERRSLSGVLALQLLATDRAARIEVKDIVLRRYNRSQAAAPPERKARLADKPALVPKWIWTREDPQPGEAAYFRRPWKQDKA
ncbi:MAG: 3-keto-disaccharide hydrolase, partial [Verrucomicrobiales bacterium]